MVAPDAILHIIELICQIITANYGNAMTPALTNIIDRLLQIIQSLIANDRPPIPVDIGYGSPVLPVDLRYRPVFDGRRGRSRSDLPGPARIPSTPVGPYGPPAPPA